MWLECAPKMSGSLFYDICVVDQVTSYGKVTSPNTNAVEYVVDDDAREWVLKREMEGFNSVLSEAIGYCLSRLVGVPTPEGGILLESKDMPLWMCRRVPDVTHWDVSHMHKVINLDQVGAMLALDAVIGNADRHAGNILLEPRADGTFFAHSIDVEQSWLLAPEDLCDESGPRSDLAPVHRQTRWLFPMVALSAHMTEAAKAMESVSAQSIRGAVGYASGLLRDARTDSFTGPLHARFQIAQQLVNQRIKQISFQQVLS